MNKAYRHVYKDGIGWVAIAENASCVSSSKGSGTVSSKTKVEVLKNFFDLRNSVVLNNGFLLKGLFAATLFCGVFVGDLKAYNAEPEEIAKIQNNGTVVYTDDQNFRVVESIENGEKIFKRVDENGNIVGEGGKKLLEFEGKYYDYEKILSMKQSDGSYLINDKYYVIPDGTLSGKGMAERPVFVERDYVYTAGGKASGKKMARLDTGDGKWYVYNLADNEKLYYARFETDNKYKENNCKTNKNTSFKDGYCYGFWQIGELETEKVAGMDVPVIDADGYYVKRIKSATELTTANEIRVYGKTLSTLNLPTGGATTPERLSLVGKDGKTVKPIKYDANDQQVKDGKKTIRDNKDGTIRLGNVARAIQDDEAVNLGQLNEKLQNVKVPYVSIKSTQTGAGSNYNSDGATGDDSIAIGPNAGASAENSVAIGPNAKASEYGSVAIGADAQAINKNSVSLGAGAKTTDEDSVAIGLNAQAQGDSSYALGAWSIAAEEGATTIGTYSRANKKDSFALGVGAKANIESSVALGSDSVADTEKGVAGFDFVTDKQSTETSPTWKSTAGAVSVGDKASNTTRQITNVAAGYADTDTVNVAQLKAGLNNKADLNAGNLSNKTGNTANETYADVWKTALGISDANIQKLAQKSVVVANGENTTVAKDTSATGDITYKVNVKLDEYAKSTDIDTKLGDYVKSVTGDDFIKVDATKKQSPALSLDTDKLANDSTFVTNIAGNKVFKNTYVTNENLEKGYTKLDGTNLFKDNTLNELNPNFKKDNWRKALDISDANIQKLAQKSVVVANGENTTVAKDTSATGDITYKVNVKLDEYAKSTDIDTKLGDYVKSVTGDDFIKVDATKKQSPALSLDTDKLANDSTFVTNIAGNKVFKNTYVTNENLEKGYTKLDGTNLFKDNTLNELNPNFKKDNWRKALDISDANIQKLAQKSVVVANGENTTVAKDTSATGDITYKVNVKLDEYAKSTDIDTKLGDYVKSVTGDDFIKVDATKKQSPALSLDTDKLANDSTFVTNIAGNKVFKNTYVTNENLEKGYTKLDGTNLFKDNTLNELNPNFKKDNWRKALDISDANIQKLAQKSVVVANGENTTVAKDTSATGDITYKVNVKLDEYAKSTDIDTKLGDYVKSVTGDDFIKVDATKKQSPALSLDTDKLANDSTFVTNIAGNKVFKNTYVTNENLEKGYTKLDGTNLFKDNTLNELNPNFKKDNWRKALDISDANIQKLAQKSVVVANGENTTVAKDTSATGDITYKVNVKLDEYAKSTDIDTKLGDYVKSVTGDDFIKVDATKKQSPALSLDTDKLANDSTFVTNIAGNKVFKNTYVTNENLEKGYTKLDGTNLFKDNTLNELNPNFKKDNWRKALDISDANIQKLAQKSVVVANGENTTVAKDTSATGDITYKVNVKLDEYAKSTDIDTKLGDYVKSVTGDDFIKVDATKKQSPALSLDTDKLANDSTFVTNIAGNKVFKNTYVTNENLEKGYTKLDGTNLFKDNTLNELNPNFKKDNWRKALDISDANIQKLAQKSVVVANGENTTVAKDTSATGDITYKVNVKLDEYAKSTDIDTKLGDYVKSVTGDDFIKVDATKKQSPALSLDTDKLANDSTFVTNIAGNKVFKNTYVTNENLEKGYTKLDGTNLFKDNTLNELNPNFKKDNWRKALDISDANIQKLAQKSVVVANGENTTVAKDTSATGDITYKVNVKLDEYAKSTDIDTKLGDYVKSVTGDDFIKVDATKKQSPALSLDTDKLANDSTFVTNIAGNKVFKNTYVTNENLEKGYTKLDGTNLFKDNTLNELNPNFKKDNWRKALDISDANIQKLAQKSVVVANGENTTVAKDTSATGDITYKVNVKLDEYAKSTDIDTKLGDYVKSVTGDDFIKVDATKKQSPALSLDTDKLANDSTFVTNIAGNKVFKNTYVTNENLEKGYTKLDGTNLFKDNTLNELNPNFKKDNWRKALDISDANIQKLAQKSVVVANGENTTVAKDTSATGDITYKVNVKLDEYAKSTDIDTKLGDYVKSVTGDDFIKVDATKKQSPALSLDTDKLANDSTFVTNIAGNKVFKNTYVTNENLEKGYTKLDGTNLFKDNTLNELNPNFKKDNWRKALDISDANIQKLAQKSVVVANGENTTVAKDTSATGDITYKVNVKLDEYAKSTDIDTKLGDYVKSVTGDDFIKVDATKKQSPALSLDTDKLANDSTFVTNIAGNKVFKNTYVTNENLEKGYTKLDGTNLFKDNTLNELNPNFKKDNWRKALDISDANIQKLAQKSVVVANGENTTVAKDTSATGDITYKVNVKLDEYAKSTDIDTKLGDYVKSVTGDDFIKVDATKKQSPALSLDTDKLANDSTFVTNIAGNKVFKNTYVTNENLEKGYTKLDGTNLFKDNTLNELNPNFKKDNWRKALDISDANIQKLAQKSVVVANGENTTVAKDTSATGDITYKVNVKLDEYAKSTDIDTKLGDYVKSVTGDDFIKVDATKKQSPALSLDTDKLANDSTFVTNIAGNKVFKNTYVTNDKLSDSGFKFTGDDTAKEIDKKLGGTISIKGGADSTKLSDKNIGVVAVNDSLQVKLAKNLLGLESAEFKKGADTTTVSAEKGISTTKTLKVTDGSGNTVAEIDKTQITDASGNKVTNINSAINNLYATTKGLTSDNALAVKYDSSTKEKIMLGGSGATKQVAIKNLASAGDINDVNNKFNAVNAGDLKTALSGVNNSIDNINNRNFISLSVSANGGTKDDIKAKENIDFTATDGITVAYNASVNKFTFSADFDSIANNNVLSNKYAMLDGSNLIATKGFKQDAWRGALGLTDANIANIFEEGKDISITKNSNNNKYTIAYTGTGGGTGTGGMSEAEVKEIINNYIGGNIINPAKFNEKLITHDVSERKTTENKSIIAAINRINKYGIGFVHVNGGDITPDPTTGKSANDSSAEGTNAIAIGPKSQANRDNSIAIGLKSQANGENSIAIGVGNVVTGKNSGAFGDPTYINGDNSYAIGNNNKIDSENTFVLGNEVRVGADMQGAVVLGSGSTAVDKAIEVSRAEVNGITYDGFKGQAAGGMILSVGAKGAERQIKNVAAGKILKDSTDAVNGSQLYATNKIIGNVANSVKNVIGGNAKVNNNGEISASDIGGTGQNNINNAIAYINKRNKSGNSYIDIDAPEGSVLPSVSKGSNSIAIGAGSSDDKRKNVVSVGNATKGLNRTITNVAPGKYGTDAVNMNQLYGVAGGLSKQINDVKKKSSAGIAGAVALGMLPQSNIPGDALVSIGTGYHDSESAVALGISKTSDNARWIFKGGVSYDSQDEVTAGASVGFHF
ncbi:YadA-like family protein [Campylobacter hominis]|uniref:YadA-like family protein n=1 Tax=Campylobacter hominis TaxID=76517 RepID=UPI000E19821A|nr:YadA-like family protein [Campylobacter hominis]SUW85456.1 putative adhesin [Campylobacter hominis]